MSLAQVLSVLASQDDEGNSLARRLAYTDAGPTLDIDPLPSAQRKGLIAVTVMAFLSFIATLVLLLFITYRLVFWRSNYARYIGYNQYIVLIYNLVLADLQQSLAFLICLKWITENKIEASSAACFLQGFWLQIGDPGSGLFVLAIAVHTFILVALGHKLSHRVFVCGVVGVWLFVAILVIIPLAAHGRFVFIPSGAWVRVLRFPDMKSIAECNTSAGSAKSTSQSVCGPIISGFSWLNSGLSAFTPSCGFSYDVGSSNRRFSETVKQKVSSACDVSLGT